MKPEGRALAVAGLLRQGYTGRQVSEMLKVTDAGGSVAVMSEPTILDSAGNRLQVGDRVQEGPDFGRVTGFTRNWLGWRVTFSWLSGYHPDEPEPTEHTEPVPGEPNTYRTPDLTLIPTQEDN